MKTVLGHYVRASDGSRVTLERYYLSNIGAKCYRITGPHFTVRFQGRLAAWRALRREGYRPLTRNPKEDS